MILTGKRVQRVRYVIKIDITLVHFNQIKVSYSKLWKVPCARALLPVAAPAVPRVQAEPAVAQLVEEAPPTTDLAATAIAVPVIVLK